jgi:hypothetical protein
VLQPLQSAVNPEPSFSMARCGRARSIDPKTSTASTDESIVARTVEVSAAIGSLSARKGATALWSSSMLWAVARPTVWVPHKRRVARQ